MANALERAKKSPVAQEFATAVIASVAKAAKEENPLSSGAVTASQGDIREAALETIARKPELQHVTNSEKWWQKRSRWAAILAGVSTALQMAEGWTGNADLNFLDPETQRLILDTGSLVGAAAAGVLALWAGLAKVPLFARWVRPGR